MQPVVSTANVSQLTADLLIATFDLDRVGLFNPKALFPVIGAREDSADSVTTALERQYLRVIGYRIYSATSSHSIRQRRR